MAGRCFKLCNWLHTHVNNFGDKDDISYSRKPVIPCGLAINANGLWVECQLKPELQDIINKNGKIFENPNDDWPFF